MFDEITNTQDVVLVTGASGFLGQHVVKLLQENDDNLDEIRCFDLIKYENKLNHKNEKTMKIIVGDICNENDVLNALEGVKWIINCANIYETENENDYNRVNVEGVNQLINGAYYHNVPYFIQVSTVDVCCGNNANYYGAENTTIVPRKHILEKYSKSKYQAELIVGRANGRFLGNGYERLRTVILRTAILYGELDPYLVPTALKVANDFKGTLYKVDNIYTRLQMCYVGNAAWACIRAKQTMVNDESVGGEEFFINDDTPILDPFDFLKPYLECKNLKVSKRAIPYLLVKLVLFLICTLIFLIQPVYKIKLPSRYSPEKIDYICTTHFFNRNKAILRLGYEPIYSAEQSHINALNYYKKL